jgi:protoporphyrinogen oxidase
LVVEQAAAPGGLARSFRYGDFTFDLGPHRFHTAVPELERFIRETLGADARTIPRRSSVRFQGRFYPWPLHPSYVLLRFPPRIALSVLLDLFRLFGKKEPKTFRDQIVNMYGETLYRHFFQGYSSKFLGVTPELTHPDWASTGIDRAIIDARLEIRSLRQLLLSAIAPRRRPETQFIYPAGGCGRFIDHLAAMHAAAGGEWLCGATIDELETGDGRIGRVRIGERVVEPSFVAWTGALHRLASLLRLPPPPLRYLALVCYNLELTEGRHFAFQWNYHSAQDVMFSRVSVPANFDPGNTPAGRRSLCVEVTCNEDDAIYTEPQRYLERLLLDLKREELLLTDHEVQAVHAERSPWAYPIYTLDYRDQLAMLKGQLARFENLAPAGRLGLFWYNNMDHCLEAAFRLADELTAKLGARA